VWAAYARRRQTGGRNGPREMTEGVQDTAGGARWFAVHVESAPVSLHHVDAASVADVSIVLTASVFRAGVFMWIRVLVQHIHGLKVWPGAQYGRCIRESYETAHFRATGCTRNCGQVLCCKLILLTADTSRKRQVVTLS
jgi:hypothetical protein